MNLALVSSFSCSDPFCLGSSSEANLHFEPLVMTFLAIECATFFISMSQATSFPMLSGVSSFEDRFWTLSFQSLVDLNFRLNSCAPLPYPLKLMLF